MSKLDKDQLEKISGGVNDLEKTENFRVDDDEGSGGRDVGVYWEEPGNAELDDAGGGDPSIGPNRG